MTHWDESGRVWEEVLFVFDDQLHFARGSMTNRE